MAKEACDEIRETKVRVIPRSEGRQWEMHWRSNPWHYVYINIAFFKDLLRNSKAKRCEFVLLIFYPKSSGLVTKTVIE